VRRWTAWKSRRTGCSPSRDLTHRSGNPHAPQCKLERVKRRDSALAIKTQNQCCPKTARIRVQCCLGTDGIGAKIQMRKSSGWEETLASGLSPRSALDLRGLDHGPNSTLLGERAPREFPPHSRSSKSLLPPSAGLYCARSRRGDRLASRTNGHWDQCEHCPSRFRRPKEERKRIQRSCLERELARKDRGVCPKLAALLVLRKKASSDPSGGDRGTPLMSQQPPQRQKTFAVLL